MGDLVYLALVLLLFLTAFGLLVLCDHLRSEEE